MYQGKKYRGNFKVDKKFLTQNLSLLKNKKILEIGCGTGQLIKWLEKNKSFTKHKKNHCSLQTFWSLKRKFKNNNFEFKFYKENVKSDWFTNKLKRHLGKFGSLIGDLPFEKLPIFIQTNFYVKGKNL
jgi:16S rRNA A1518/A1519 N6-dimethyltransferase RsmA/KsgA/DIM1 with predicted DNA glycosylase/AP lyase activity